MARRPTPIRPAPPRFASRSRLWHPIALLVIGALITIGYANSLDGEFHLDDLTFKDDPTLQLHELSPQSLAQAIWHRRPVASVTFALNYYWGRHQVFGYHVVNLAIHAACATALYALLVLIFHLPRAQPIFAGLEAPAALGATLLWAMHPVQTQAVTYVVQRMTSLAALFYVLALVAYLKGRLSHGRQRGLWWTGALGTGALALGSKEMAATLPLAVLLAEVCLVGGLDRPTLRVATRWIAILSVPIFVIGVFAAQHEAGGSFWAQLTAHRSTTQWFTATEHLLTEGRVVVYYLTLLLLPHSSRLTFDYAFPVSHGWLDPPTTLLSWIVILGIMAWAFFQIPRSPFLAFGVLWFFLNLAIESSVIPLDLVFEHRLYLPSMGLAIVAALAGARLQRRTTLVRYVPILLGGLLVLIWTGWTIERNRVWATEFTLWSDTAAKAPGNPRALTLLGVAYTDRHEPDRAYEAFQTAIRANPDFHDAHANLGSALIGRGDLAGALEAFTRARTLEPKNAEDAYHRGLIYYKLGRLEEARREYETSLLLAPEDAKTHNNLGAVHQAAGRWEAARAEYETALRLDPGLAAASYGLGQVYQHVGRTDEAILAFREVIRANATHLDAHLALAGIYLGRDDKPAALEWFQAALRLAPTSPQGHFQVARLLDQLGRRSEALAAYRRFLDLATEDQAKTRAWVEERIRALELHQG